MARLCFCGLGSANLASAVTCNDVYVLTFRDDL